MQPLPSLPSVCRFLPSSLLRSACFSLLQAPDLNSTLVALSDQKVRKIIYRNRTRDALSLRSVWAASVCHEAPTAAHTPGSSWPLQTGGRFPPCTYPPSCRNPSTCRELTFPPKWMRSLAQLQDRQGEQKASKPGERNLGDS